MPELHFKGKEFVYNHHLSVPYRPLVIDNDKSVGATHDLNNNLIIHGDNLHALKALMPLYAGKVDCVFIDPPYNTGNEGWCYNDNVNSPMLKEWLATNPVGLEDGLRHDKWLTMMWPRLTLIKELLNEDGLLFISINEIEGARLKCILADIFGESAVLGQFIWKSRQNKDNRNVSGLSDDHEFILIVGKQLKGEERIAESFDNPDNDPRGAWASGNMVGLASPEARPNLHYDLINPLTGINYGCPSRGWRYEPSTMQKLISENKIIWPSSPDGRPREKQFVSEMPLHSNVSSVINLPLFTRNGTEAFEKIFGNREFPFPKPPELVEYLIRQHPNPNAIVLDNFAGSGTTAQSVLNANTKDGGNRRFILVECMDYADTITAERIRRVISGYKFKGTTREELYRENITFNRLKNSKKLFEHIASIENLESHRFDNIKKEIKDGILVITGEKNITEKVEGLGGSFTYCTLGEPIDLDGILTGKNLPSYEAIGSWLFHTATGDALDTSRIDKANWYLGETSAFYVWLIYKPELEFLKSRDSALTLNLAENIAKAKQGKKHLVFAPAKFVPNKTLLPLGVEYAPLPFSLYKLEKV